MFLTPHVENTLALNDEPLRLAAGGVLPQVEIAYAIYGELNKERDNAVLVCHALSGSARVADWWAGMFSKLAANESLDADESFARPFDLRRDCIIGVNVIGSCYGSTGPRSTNPATGETYAADFPVVSVSDMVRAQARFIERLDIACLRAVVGGSIGGMQALQWAVDFPDKVERAIAIGACPLPALGLALNHLQRQAIMSDPMWQQGRYSLAHPPVAGLALARQIAMCSYKSPQLFDERFARRTNRNGEDPRRRLAERFEVGGYLDYQGARFNERFDANSYLLLTKAMDTFDPALDYAGEQTAYARIRAATTLIGISSDWLFPARDVRRLAAELSDAGATVNYRELESAHGHDGFLADTDRLAPLITEALHSAKSA